MPPFLASWVAAASGGFDVPLITAILTAAGGIITAIVIAVRARSDMRTSDANAEKAEAEAREANARTVVMLATPLNDMVERLERRIREYEEKLTELRDSVQEKDREIETQARKIHNLGEQIAVERRSYEQLLVRLQSQRLLGRDPTSGPTPGQEDDPTSPIR